MAGQKRTSISAVPNSTRGTYRKQVSPTEDAVLPDTTNVPVTAPVLTSGFSGVPTATSSTFEVLDNIRVNTLGAGTDASVFSAIDKSKGFYDLNFKGFAVSGDLELIETPTTIVLGIKAPEVQPTFIESGVNLDQTGGRIYKGVDGSTLQFRTIQVGPNLTVQQTANTVEIGLGFTPTTGDISGAANIGAIGSEVFHSKDGSTLNFRRLASSSNALSLSLDSSGTQIIFTVNENQFNIANFSGVLPASRVAGLHPIATSADYNQLNNKPLIPTTLSTLSDVSGTPTNGSVLRYVSGTGWIPGNVDASNAIGTVRAGPNTIVATTPNTDIRFNPGSELTVEANVIDRSVTYNLKPTGVTAGSYTNTNIQVDSFGRIIGITNGTSSGSSNYVDPLTTSGDMVVRSGSTTARLGIGSNDQILTVVNGMPTWKTFSAPAGSGTVRSVGLFGKNGINIEGGPITDSGLINVGLKPTGVAAGTYTNATVQVDLYGRIISAGNGSGGGAGGTPIRVDTGYGLTGGGPLTSNLTLALQKTGVTAGTYTSPRVQVDEYGRVMSIQNGAGGGGGGVTSVSGAGANGINVTGGPITDTGTLTVTLTDTGVTPGQVALKRFTVNSAGRITNVNNTADLDLEVNIMNVSSGEPIIDKAGGIYFAAYTESEIKNKNHAVNTQNKGLGKCILCITNYQLYFATEETPTAPWARFGGLPADFFTPV